MAVKVKVELNSPGIKELLNSPEVAGELERRGLRVVDAARNANVPSGLQKTWRDSIKGKVEHTDRAVYTVGTYVALGKKVALDTGALTRALDAAAGG